MPLSNPIAQIERFDINDYLIDIDAFEPNDVRSLTIYSTYSTNKSGAGTANFQEITADCVYKSNDTNVATVDAGGLVTAVKDGRTNITVSYTAAPGSTNRSASAIGKIPITISINVSVLVTTVPIRMGGRTTQWPGGDPAMMNHDWKAR